MVFTWLLIRNNILISKTIPSVSIYCWKTMSVFVQKLNVLTGKTEWTIQDENYDFHQEIARSAFADMLHDTDRNKKYYAALKQAIEEKHEAGETARVLDIGTGTGLLSMMAAANNADSIVACECFSPIAAVAKEVVCQNGFEDRIKVVAKRSTELILGEDLEERANILVAEVFDTELIGEGAIETFNHAKEHLLEENAIVIPSVGRMMVAVIESTTLAAFNNLSSKWPVSPGKEILVPGNILCCEGSPSLHDIQASEIPRESFRLLTKPVEAFRFDFGEGKIPVKEKKLKELVVEAAGIGHGLVMWWELDMLPTSPCPVISCAPTWIESPDIAWRDHWLQAVYYFRSPVSLQEGQQAILSSYHDQFSLWFDISKTENEETVLEAPVCTCGFHATTSRMRTAFMNDKSLWNKYIEILHKSVRPSSVVMFIGDMSLLPLAAAQLGAKKVYCVEENRAAYTVMKSIIAENKLEDRVILLPEYRLDLEENVTDVFSEPYFRTGLFPWDGLKTWYLSRTLFPEIPLLFPQNAIIRALPIQFHHLHKIRALLRSVEGFNMAAFDSLIQRSSKISDLTVETHPLWEYGGIALGFPQEIMSFKFTENIPEEFITRTGQMPIVREGTCNGVALWMDWLEDDRLIHTSGPTKPPFPGEELHWNLITKQAVYFFPDKTNNVLPGSFVNFSATFEPKDILCEFNFIVSCTTK